MHGFGVRNLAGQVISGLIWDQQFSEIRLVHHFVGKGNKNVHAASIGLKCDKQRERFCQTGGY